MKFYRLLLAMCLLALAMVGCGKQNNEKAYDNTVTLLVNGKIHTTNEAQPWADAMAIKNGKILEVGSKEDVLRAIGSEQTVVTKDLHGQYVFPGLIDAHTHPGLVGITGESGASAKLAIPDTNVQLPDKSPEELLAWLKDYGDKHFDPVIVLGSWDVAKYLPGGPRKEDLDAIFPYRPVILFDNSGHSFWLNSMALRLLGINKDTPDMSAGLSMFVRDKNGEPTGWVKEFAIVQKLLYWNSFGRSRIKENILEYLKFLSSGGVTTVFDAGNFDLADLIYSVVKELDQEGKLPVRYEASIHIFKPDQRHNVIADLRKMKAQYETEKLHINTVKIHLDGVSELGTAAMLDPYVLGSGYGGLLFDVKQLTDLVLELDREAVNLHIHAVGDRAVRTVLDAIEASRHAKGAKLAIQVTLSHLQFINPVDLPRFSQLGVFANMTPHWLGGDRTMKAAAMMVGEPRVSHMNMLKELVDAKAKVTFSSDVIGWEEIPRANPFVGIQIGMTRRDYSENSNVKPTPPENQTCDFQTMLRGYTVTGAEQLGKRNSIGSIRPGFLADLMIFNKNPLETEVNKIHGLKPNVVILGGVVVSGTLD